MLDTLQIMTLLELPRVGKATVRQMLGLLDGPVNDLRDLYEAMLACKSRLKRLPAPDYGSLASARERAVRQLEQCAALGIRALGFLDEQFPARLKTIPKPPVLLYAKGNIDCLQAPASAAVAGTRSPSEYGARIAFKYGEYLARSGLAVVSGLALGCDEHAHRGCLAAGGRTVAVLAHGLDMVYPFRNRELARQIETGSGCLLSEYKLGSVPESNMYVERDRLQVGLADGLIVIETGVTGGTMHTVGFCLEQGKGLGCFDHPRKFLKSNEKAAGNRYLIGQGKAVPLFDRGSLDSFVAHITSR